MDTTAGGGCRHAAGALEQESATFDPDLVRQSFAGLTPHADWVSKYFYAHLFKNNPGVRSLFPAEMDLQRDRLVGALIRIVGDLRDSPRLIAYLQDLGRSHSFDLGVRPEHYPAVGASLIATLKMLSKELWTAELEASWAAAYDVIAEVMITAANQAEEQRVAEAGPDDEAAIAASMPPAAPRHLASVINLTEARAQAEVA